MKAKAQLNLPFSPEELLDLPLYGAEPIGREARLFDANGNVDIRRTDHALEKGYIDASKFGRMWVSTPRRVRRAFAGGV